MRAGRAAAVLRSGGGAAVLAQQAQPCRHQHLSVTIAGRWPKVEAAVGPSPVVVLDVLLQDAPEVALVHNQKPVQRLAASGRDPALGDRVRLRTARRTSVPSAASTESKAAANLASRSRIRKRGRRPSSVNSQVRLRACCVTQPESGLSVQAAKRIRRLSRWMKKRT
jgi:hypothetical protein